ncbi:MAG: VapC toxin family PIN domain ribonuclease, partial [Alphaproteobacteria bacterium]|nr:VapC toxin family PIN domain ribonuclease [Alphaproteobacteria bacterium]
MRVVDTSAWIEWLRLSETGRKVEDHLPEQNQWI